MVGKCNLDRRESRVKSICGNVVAFVFTNGNFVEACAKPSKDQHEADDAFLRFCTDSGVPIKLKSDMAGSFEERDIEFHK